MGSLLIIAIGSALVSNVVLSQFLGICPFLGVSKKVDTAMGMGAAVIFVITLASVITIIVYDFIMVPLGVEYLQTIVFILVIAALVQFVEMFLKKSKRPDRNPPHRWLPARLLPDRQSHPDEHPWNALSGYSHGLSDPACPR